MGHKSFMVTLNVASIQSLHGLWPMFDTSTPKDSKQSYPVNCVSNYKFCKNAVPSLARKYAPNYGKGLAKHGKTLSLSHIVEWKKHGSCSGLSPESYFNEGLRLMLSFDRFDRGTPRVIIDNVGKKISTKAIRDAYKKRIAIKVSSHGELEEISSCFEKRKDGKAGHQIDCPLSVMNSFRNNVCKKKKCLKQVKIVSLNQCDK